MGSEKTDRLSTADAKDKLRQALDEVGLHAWVKRRPFEALAMSFGVGLILAASKPMRSAMLRMFVHLI